jgi:pyruvate dehydrogenase kinase 2/3/4
MRAYRKCLRTAVRGCFHSLPRGFRYPPTAPVLSSFSNASSGASDLQLLSDDISYFASKKQTGVSLRTLTETGRGEFVQEVVEVDASKQDAGRRQRMLFQVAMFLHRELPIRLAHRVRDLDCIPHLSTLPSTRAVRQMYATSFEEIRAASTPNTIAREGAFADLLQNVYSRHSAVLLMMARSAYEARSNLKDANSFTQQDEVHQFLDSFYMSRIGIRMLIGQYLALRDEADSDYVGLVSQHCSPAHVAHNAMEDAK